MGRLKQDRLALVSGTILVWGVVLVQLWNVAARFQTGGNIRPWTGNTPGQGVLAPLWIFWFITALMTFGGWAVTLSVVHVLCHGLSLMDEPAGNAAQSVPPSGTLTALRYWTYVGVFVQWSIVLMMLVLVPLVLLSAGLEQIMAHFMPARLASWVARMLVSILLGVAAYKTVLRLAPRFIRLFQVYGFAAMILPALLFCFSVSWVAVIESCYTVSLSTDARVLRHDQGVTVTVALGGATSALSQARLELVNEKGAVLQTLALHEATEPGDYFSYIAATALAPGSYRVTLEYPHSSLSSAFPFIHGTILRSQAFLVLP